jgi:uncharacterized YigZ family protein
MLPEYRTIYRGGEDEIVEKKSRFIATVVPVNTEEEALEFVEKTRKKYWDARHNCFAYIIGERGQLQRCSDDGEPNGTAGKPMLDVLLGNELRNVAVVVTRYFGGTLLGTGGLVRAYSAAVQEGLKESLIIEKFLCRRVRMSMDYTMLGKMQYLAAKLNLMILDTFYTDGVEMQLLVPDEQFQSFIKEVTEASNGKVAPETEGSCYGADVEGRTEIFDA